MRLVMIPFVLSFITPALNEVAQAASKRDKFLCRATCVAVISSQSASSASSRSEQHAFEFKLEFAEPAVNCQKLEIYPEGRPRYIGPEMPLS